MRQNRFQQTAQRRLAVLALILVLWVCAIVGRLVQVQIFQHRKYVNYAESQQNATVKLLAPRGTIYDRNGKALALSLEQDSIAINPMRLDDPKQAASLLAPIFQLDQNALEAKIRLYKTNKWGFLWIRRWATNEEAAAARKLRYDKVAKADWIEFYREHKRYYPKHELASQILGSVGVEESGLFGAEYKFEKLLAGIDGETSMLRDVEQRDIESRIIKEPRPGSSIRLAIDERIQYAAETALKKAIHEQKLPSGNVVVMDPHTGDVLAMASYPDFDPNVRPRTRADLDRRINRSMSLIYEPGSVFKVITLAAALEKTRLTPASIINCGGGAYRVPGRTIRDHHSYSSLSMEQVLAKSSNVGAINIANAVGKNAMYEYVRAFGFGERTGIELPFEEPGYVWRMDTINTPKIYESILASVAMGHQISTTTLQLAQACSVIANGGTLVRPRMLLETQSASGEITKQPVKRERRVVRPETAITMRKMMETVVLEGTGKGARVPGRTAGGKTGTAQIFDLEQKRYLHEYYASFMGFAPVQNPAVVVVVTLDRSKQYGGTVAAPVFQEVASEALRILDVPMDNPATAVASQGKPKVEEMEEGDFTLASAGLAVDASKLLPDTRRQIVRMLSDAIEKDPEIKDLMVPAAHARSLVEEDRSRYYGDRATADVSTADATKTASARENAEVSAKKQFEEEARRFEGRLAEEEANVASSRTVRIVLRRNVVPSFAGKSMRDALKTALQEGVEISAYGRGTARAQIPPAGAELPEGEAVRVLFTP